MRTILCSVLVAFACGTNGGNTMQDLAMPHDMAAPSGSDLAFASMCGHPGDNGNSIGVGKFCMGMLTNNPDCPSSVPICANGEMSTVFFCTLPCSCTPNTPGTICTDPVCKEAAVCQCNNLGCGCVPSACAMPQG